MIGNRNRPGLSLVALLLLGAAEPTPLPTPAQIAARALRRADPYTLDLARDAGALPGPEHAARNRQALQNLINALSPTLMPERGGELWGRITVPNRIYWIDGPVWWDQARTELVGDGPNAALRMVGGREDACLVLGASRRPEGRALRAGTFPDLFGRLDATAAPSAGRRWGVRTGKDHHLAGMASPLAFGPDRWAKTQAVTLDFALDTHGRPLSSGPVFGAQEGNDPAPIAVRSERDGRFTVLWKLAGGGTSVLQFAAPVEPGVLRVRAQIDLARREASASINGQPCRELEETWRTTAPLGQDYFPAHQHAPFLVGAAGDKALSHGSTPLGSDPNHEILLLGLHVSMGLRPPARDDRATYFTTGPDTIALLPMDQPATQCAFWRTLPVQAGPALGGRRSSLLVFDPYHATPFSSIGDYRLQRLKVGHYGETRHGQAIAMAHALHVAIERCTLEGGAHALGCLGSSANYVVRLRDCTVSGRDAALFAWYCQWDASDLHVPYCGRAGVLRNHLGQVALRRTFVGPYGEPETIVRATGGATTTLDSLNVDIEGGPFPSLAAFWAETGSPPTIGGLRIRNVVVGSVPQAVPLLKLVDAVPGAPAATVRVEGLVHQNGPRTVVETTGPGWRGTVVMDHDLGDAPPVQHRGPGASRVVVDAAGDHGAPDRKK